MEDRLSMFRPWLRGLPLIVAAMALGIMAARKYLSYVTPMYESTVKLRLADAKEGVPDANLYKDLDVFVTSNKIGVEMEVMKSQVLLDKVFDQLDFDLEMCRVGDIRSVELYGNSPITLHYSAVNDKARDRNFELIMHDTSLFTLKMPDGTTEFQGRTGTVLHTPMLDLLVTANDSVLLKNPGIKVADRYKFRVFSRKKLYSSVLKNLDIVAVDKDVAVLRLSYKSPNPAKAAALINKLAEVYIQDYIETKYKAAHVTVNFLDDQIDGVVTKLAGAENQIQAYRDQNSITNIRQETETDLRKISQLKIQQTNMRMNFEAIQELERYVRSGQDRFLELAPNFEAFTDLLSTEMVKKIKTLQSEKKDLQLTYTDEDDRVKVIDAKIADLTRYLTESITNTRKNLEIKTRNLDNDIEAAEQVFIGVPGKEKMLNILDREFQIYQQSYNFLNEKKIEAEIAQAAKMAFHRIITPAYIADEPVSPNKTVITIVAAMLAMFGAIFLIFMVHLLKAKVNDLKSIETVSALPVVMLTPKLRTDAAREQHFLKEAIQLELKGMVGPGKVLCISGYRGEEGAVYNALHLCKAFVQQGRKVLLVDAENQLKADSTELNGFDYTTLVDPVFLRSTMESMREWVEQRRAQYDQVVILNEALTNPRIALLLMSVADANLMVLDARLTPRRRITEASLLNEEFALPRMGFVVNRHAYYPGVLEEWAQFIRKIVKKQVKK